MRFVALDELLYSSEPVQSSHLKMVMIMEAFNGEAVCVCVMVVVVMGLNEIIII